MMKTDSRVYKEAESMSEITEKKITRGEYYASMGFSGSQIDRPDDPVDDEFIKHCEGLRKITEGFTFIWVS